MDRATSLTIVQTIVDRELARLRRKKLPHLDTVVVRVLWSGKTGADLLGEFIGTPLADYSIGDSGQLQNEVLLYTKNLVAAFGVGTRLKQEIRITLLHELGHALGFEEYDLVRLGLD